ncbi:nucleoside 2-deoxyribosyltransferase [Sporosarcina beigongshangi]|uniref:nucleoside 2-deoxyribosyltransferase n=1 Tax=Sporosarcina beigongshangi TaxID=2782538 RepID=UPI00193A082C|nr:nucleoside 2-deoxyribosyltransferase [Sporosarcina beigongshangi]
MKFYLASSLLNKQVVNYVSEKLVEAGYIHTYDWTKNDRPSTLEELKAIGEAEKNAILASDVVVILLPGGKGSHIELGIALGRVKKIFLYSADGTMNDFDTTSTFYHLSEVEQVIGTLDELVERVCNFRGSYR